MIKLHEDLIKYNKVSSKTKILQETYHTEGLLDIAIDQVTQDLKSFGTLVKDVAKLIGNDIGFMSQFLDPRLKSWETWDKRREKYNDRRAKILSDLKVDVNQFKGGDALTKFALSPGGWAFGVAKKVDPKNFFKKEFREQCAEYGADQIPVVGWLFRKENVYGDGGSNSPFVKMIQMTDPANPDKKELQIAFNDWSKDPFNWANSKDPDTKGGTIWNVLKKAQKLFLITDGVDEVDGLLYEGEEEDSDQLEEKDITEYPKMVKMLQEIITEYLEENWPLDRDAFIENHRKFYDRVVTEASETIANIGTMSSTVDPEQFFKSLESLKKQHESFDINIEDMKSKFTQSVESVKNNEETMQKLKDELGDELTEGDEENASEDKLNSKIGSIVLSGFKAKFLQGVKENLVDFYERIYNDMTDGLDEEVLKTTPNEYDTKFLEVTTEYRNKLTDAISKFKQS